MPVMNFDLEDGLPPVSFSINGEGAERMMNFMSECQQDRDARAMLVAELEQLRAEKATQPIVTIKGDGAIEERIKTLMRDVGMPDSTSLYLAMKQLQNEIEQGIVVDYSAASAKPVEQEPVAWGILSDTCPELTNDPVLGNYWERKGRKVTPLYAAPQAPQAAPGWQPIETAPKDAPIWAFNGDQGVMRWLVVDDDLALWIWVDELLSDTDPSPDQPTHYMPLPAAPEVQPRTKGGAA